LHITKLGGIPTVIFGSGKTGRLLADCLMGSIRTGYIPALILDNNPDGDDEYRNIPIIHDTSVGPEIVKRYNIKMAIIAMPELETERLKNLLNTSVKAFRYNVLIPNFFSISNIWMSVRDFNGLLGFETSHKLKLGWYLIIKRFMDLFLVIFGGIIILPFLLIIALIIKIDSPGPVLYRHKRLGRNSREFYAYKFRSMTIDAQERLEEMLATDRAVRIEWEKNQKLQNDPRITRFGKILRRTSFDEFPQLLNIIKGDMSLVGPRPIVYGEVNKYGGDYNQISSIRPGLTGLWQVSGRSNTNYHERVSYDTYYLQSWSVWLDLWIIFKTFGVVIKGEGAY
jgi:Undecaprenyl-phosphate galactose phosphotransferase WbaP